MNDTTATLPDESLLELPATWEGRLLPWRGKRPGREVRLDPEAPATVRELIRLCRRELTKALDRPHNSAYAEAAHAYCDGAPDARGAGAVIELLRHSEAWRSRSEFRPALDAWVFDHGLPFAVCASIELLTVAAVRSRRARFQDIGERDLEPRSVSRLHPVVRGLREGIIILRSLLAEASDEEYAAVVAAAAAHRDTPLKRVIAMLMLPGERDWSDEACLDYAPACWGRYMELLVLHSVDCAERFAAAEFSGIDGYRLTDEMLAALVAAVGVECVPMLAERLETPMSVPDRRRLLDAVALLPSDRAMEYLLGHLTEPHVFQSAIAAAARFPVRALRSIARAAAGADLDRRRRLYALTTANPALTKAARRMLTENELVALDGLREGLQAVEAAAADELPPLLVTPPWKRKRSKGTAVTIAGLEASTETRLAWAPGEHERWSSLEPRDSRYSVDAWKYLATVAERLGGERYAFVLAYAPMAVAAPLAERSTTPISPYEVEDLQAIIGRFGAEAADRAMRSLSANTHFHEALPPIVSVEAARLAADWLTRLKSARPSAAAWFERNGVEGVRLLIPDALGSDKKARRAAEAALTYVAKLHGADVVRTAAEHYGEAARDAIVALLEADPLDPRGVKVPKPPPWADAALLPQVLLRGRRAALPPESTAHLITVLAIDMPELPYAGVEVVAEACDRDSLRDFSWSLFELWLSAGAPPKDGWALTQLRHFADDGTVRRLAPLIREWPGQSQHKRAVVGLEVLGAIGSEEALRAIRGISQKVRFKALKEKAREQIEKIAADLGLSTEQLADRLVPDFGFDGELSLVLDYGPRRFTVGFDEQLKPFVTDEDGKPRKILPRPSAKDDAEIAEAAYKRFAQLKKELRSVATEQLGRLEKAMVEGRTWTTEEFREHFVDHALMWHLTRRLLWTAESGGVRTAFRLAEDRSCTDVEEHEIELSEDAVIRLAHPAHLDRESLEAWSEILADYEVLQPFSQLTRPVMAFTEQELETGRIERFEDAEVDVGKILGLSRRGWRRAAPEQGGVEPGISYPLPGGGFVVVDLEPGIDIREVEQTPRQKLRSVRLLAVETYWLRYDRPPVHLGEVDPVAASEALCALARITGID